MLADRPTIHYSWIVLATGTAVVFGSLGLARFGYSVVLPAMQQGLSLDNTQAGMLASANLVGYLALSAVGGAMASRFGPRMVVSIGLAVAGLSMVLTGFVDRLLPAALWRFVSGIGSGASNVPVMGLLAAWFTVQRRGLASGVAVSGSSIALILLGPVVPPVLAAFKDDGWRICWFLFGSATLILAAISYLLIRNRPEVKGIKPYGNEALGSSETQGNAETLSWRHVYRSLTVWHLGLVYVAFGFSYIIYMTFFVKRLVSEGGYSPEAAGNLFMVMGWLSLVCGISWGWVSDVIGRRRTLIIIYLIHGIAFGLFALWPQPTGFILSAALFGISAWSIPAIMAAACGDILGPRMAPAALGFITLFFGIGQALGPSVAGHLADLSGSFAPSFLLAAAVAIFGAVGSYLLRFVSAGLGFENASAD